MKSQELQPRPENFLNTQAGGGSPSKSSNNNTQRSSRDRSRSCSLSRSSSRASSQRRVSYANVASKSGIISKYSGPNNSFITLSDTVKNKKLLNALHHKCYSQSSEKYISVASLLPAAHQLGPIASQLGPVSSPLGPVDPS